VRGPGVRGVVTDLAKIATHVYIHCQNDCTGIRMRRLDTTIFIQQILLITEHHIYYLIHPLILFILVY
jgi:hypothetical protein